MGPTYQVDHRRATVTHEGLTTKVRPFPISVDFDSIATRAASPEVEAEMERLQKQFGLRDRLVGLGVDRIDYTKGIPEQLIAIDRFLERHPEFLKRFVFVEIGVPSRAHIEVYQRLNDEIDRLVKSINWKYQTDNWKPILFLKRPAPPRTLQAWYRLAKICVISSLHDGMNLVAKEFVASRIHDDGVLMLSRFTGAARELTDAELINPYAVDDVAEAFYRAATMPLEEQQRRMRTLKAQVSEQNIYTWASKILTALFKFEFQQV